MLDIQGQDIGGYLFGIKSCPPNFLSLKMKRKIILEISILSLSNEQRRLFTVELVAFIFVECDYKSSCLMHYFIWSMDDFGAFVYLKIKGKITTSKVTIAIIEKRIYDHDWSFCLLKWKILHITIQWKICYCCKTLSQFVQSLMEIY